MILILAHKEGITVKEVLRRIYGIEEPKASEYNLASHDLYRLHSQGLLYRDYGYVIAKNGFSRKHVIYKISEEGKKFLQLLKKFLEDVEDEN